MSNFFVKQKIGKNIYIYEVTSYWDSIRKTTKQKRKYIGKLTDSGEIVTPKKSVYPVYAKQFGATYLFEELSKKIGLYDLLNKTFPDKAEDILSLAIFFAIEHKRIDAYPDYIQSTYTAFRCNDSSTIIALLKEITDAQTQRSDFLKFWQEKQIQSDKSLYIDIKLYSDKNIYENQFYKTDRCLSFTHRIGLIINQDNYIPLSYHLYANKLIDASDIKGFISDYTIPKIFILESDFSNYYDINSLNSFNIKFIMPHSEIGNTASNKAFKYLFKKSDYCGTNYLAANKTLYIYNTKLKLHIFFNEKERLGEADNFIKSLSELESLMKLKIFNNADEAKMFMNNKLNNSSKYYEVSIIDKKAILKKKKWVISHEFNKMAKVLFITNNLDLNENEILSIYSIKHDIEAFFDLTVSNIGAYSQSAKSKQVFEGRLFIQFISFILFSAFQATLKAHELFKTSTIEHILSELKDLKMIRLSNNKNILSEKNKLHSDIFNLFCIKVPN